MYTISFNIDIMTAAPRTQLQFTCDNHLSWLGVEVVTLGSSDPLFHEGSYHLNFNILWGNGTSVSKKSYFTGDLNPQNGRNTHFPHMFWRLI